MRKYVFPPAKILVATDLGPASRAAMGFAKMLHARFGSEVGVLHACHLDLPPYFSIGQMDALKKEIGRANRSAEEYVRRESKSALGFDADVAVIDKPPLDAILGAAEVQGTGLIVMGTHGRQGTSRLMLGSVAERVIRHSPIPVLVAREAMVAAPFKHVLCPFNFTDTGKTALEYAVDAAHAAGAQLTILHSREAGADHAMCAAIDQSVRSRCRTVEIPQHGEAAENILETVEHARPDVIVMGAGQKSRLFGELFSGTTERVMRLAEVPLLVVPEAPIPA